MSRARPPLVVVMSAIAVVGVLLIAGMYGLLPWLSTRSTSDPADADADADATSCLIAKLPRPSPRRGASDDAPDLVVDSQQLETRCISGWIRRGHPEDEGEEHAYAQDPIHEVFDRCDAPLHSFLTAWLDEQVRPPLNPQLHVAARKARVSRDGAAVMVVSDWTLEPGALLDEPIVVHVQESVNQLIIRLEVDSLDGAPAAEAESVLRTIVRKGIRTMGTTTWNGAPHPYTMKLWAYDNVDACRRDGRATSPREFGPASPDPWGAEPDTRSGDPVELGLVGRAFALGPGTLEARLYTTPPPVPWPETIRARRTGAMVSIELLRHLADEEH